MRLIFLCIAVGIEREVRTRLEPEMDVGRELESALRSTQERLMAEAVAGGYWEGELSSSALATAVAVIALRLADPTGYDREIRAGLNWLRRRINSDGGWGDTPDSPSNLSTTLLVWCAFSGEENKDPQYLAVLSRCEAWLREKLGGLEGQRIVTSVLRAYGADRTFSVPILATCGLTGKLGPEPDAWEYVPQLPFELALVPESILRWLHMPVVSYALPALIALGILRFTRLCLDSPPRTLLRRWLLKPALRVLARLQPENGGFLEAPPLTAFVLMSLAASGHAAHQTARRAAHFLLSSCRSDGSWPIDSNLSTWVTTLAVEALMEQPEVPVEGVRLSTSSLKRWLLDQQTARRHPFTGAQPGGWGWTDRPGSVPDADDTAGALLALRRLGPVDEATRIAAHLGVRWLVGLQNSDGGVPTFCRGWGSLPFDRSCPDITAHALQAFDAWYDELVPSMRSKVDVAMHRAVTYLAGVQQEDGSWIPLWFGNQLAPSQVNPTYGTATVVHALRAITPGRLPDSDPLVEQGVAWLARTQNPDGGWGGAAGVPSTIEETALAVRALVGTDRTREVLAGLKWLLAATDCGRYFPTAPIGLYFASLWYSEKLYPIIFVLSAQKAAAARLFGSDFRGFQIR